MPNNCRAASPQDSASGGELDGARLALFSDGHSALKTTSPPKLFRLFDCLRFVFGDEKPRHRNPAFRQQLLAMVF